MSINFPPVEPLLKIINGIFSDADKAPPYDQLSVQCQVTQAIRDWYPSENDLPEDKS